MRIFLLLTAALLPAWLSAQTITDPFEDGNFLNPAWSGDTLEFAQANGQLESNGPAASATLSIATGAPSGTELEWRIDLEYMFAPSTSNFLRFYLLADTANLETDLNGYYLQAGESGSNDSYDLFRQDGSASTKIIDGLDSRAASEILATVRIRRATNGDWTLETDDGSGIWQSQGSVNDATYPAGNWMGIQVRHSSTRNQSFSFDNLYAGPWELDLTPPAIQSLLVTGNNELQVRFTEAVDSASVATPSNYVVDQGIGSPFLAQRLSPDRVLLEFADEFVDEQTYVLQVSGVEDLAGNVIAAGTSQTFTYEAPIQYYEGMVRFNEIHFDPTPVVGLPDAEYLELINRSEEFLQMAGWTIGVNPGSGGMLDSMLLYPGSVLLLTDEADTALFTAVANKVVMDPWVTLSNNGLTLYLTAPDGTLVDSVSYDASFFSIPSKASGGYSLELINPNNLSCPAIVNWDGATDPSGGTPGRENSLYDPLYDQTSPTPVSAIVTSDNTVQVCFNLPMARSNLDDADKYILEGFASPDEVFVEEPLAQCVTLFFGGAIPVGQAYTLRILSQNSCFASGSGFQEDSIQVIRGFPAGPGDVLINEFLADENPSAGLPEAEFVEIYNASGKYLNLTNGGISDGGSVKNWQNASLAPGEYAIVTDRDDSLAFAAYGKVFPVDGLPSLNNTRDLIRLVNVAGETLDEIEYEFSWYRGSDKSAGGYTLEKIYRELSGCNLPGNWQVSNASQGGTPGEVNSVDGPYQDTVPPMLEAVGFDDPQTIRLQFDEQLGEGAVLETNFVIKPLDIQPLVVSLSDNETALFLLFDQVFPENEVFTLMMTDVSDCSGNSYSDSVRIGLPVAAKPGDILLSEVLFNPFPGGSDFVEIYNTSGNVLDLSELFVGEMFPGTDSIFNADQVSTEAVLLLPGEYRCLTANVAIQQATYLPPANARFHEMSSFPTYDDREGGVVVFTATGQILDRFFYLDDYHYPDLRDDEGISLERLSFSLPTNQPDNWHSAASTVRFATPGYANSQQAADRVADEQPVTVSPKVITPDADGVEDVLGIHYEFSRPGMNARVTILDRAGRPVKVIRQQELLGTEAGTFFWDGRMDSGQRAPIGAYVVVFEVTNQQSGTREVYKAACVVGS